MKQMLLQQKDYLQNSQRAFYSRFDCLRWAIQLASAVAHLHAQIPKVVHRDIKLDNILLTSKNPSDAEVRLTDFGLARQVADASGCAGGGGSVELFVVNFECDLTG